MKRWIAATALLVVLPLASAADCKKKCDSATGDCNPRPATETPAPSPSDKCVMTANGCISPRPRT